MYRAGLRSWSGYLMHALGGVCNAKLQLDYMHSGGMSPLVIVCNGELFET